VPWHRVVAANGRLVPGNEQEALRRHREEGTPLRSGKVDMRRAAWWPEHPADLGVVVPEMSEETKAKAKG
jgi:hypothetical protein